MDPLRVFHQIRGTHEEPFQLRKLAFGQSGMSPTQKIAYQKAKNRISQEFELLVIAFSRLLFVGVRAVSQRLDQKLWIRESVTKLEFQIFETIHKAKGR